MKTITEQDKDKRYFLDTDRSQEVRLVEVMEDSWVKIVYPDGRHINVVAARLTEITEVPLLEKITDDILDYPTKATRVEIEYTDESGETSYKAIEGGDAILWNKWMRELCYKAEELGVNPPFYNLGFHEIKKKKK